MAEANMLKYQNYKEQFGRLNKALANGFNLEAVFIEYAIIEDRTESILKHAGEWDSYINSLKGREATLHSKVKRIQKLAENKKSLLHKYFSDDLLDAIIEWKDQRNRLIHALLKQNIETGEIPDFALRGKELACKLRNKSNSFIKAYEKPNSDANN